MYTEDPHDYNIFSNSCGENRNQVCFTCNQSVHSAILRNGTFKFSIRGEGGCNKLPTIYCPMVSRTGIYVVQNDIIDPQSFVNSTYIAYI